MKHIATVSGGKDSTAMLYALGRVLKEVAVTRYCKDEYSMGVAAKEAVSKLFKPQGFTGRAMFVGENTGDHRFTRGKYTSLPTVSVLTKRYTGEEKQ